jgi:hypothetical protein
MLGSTTVSRMPVRVNGIDTYVPQAPVVRPERILRIQGYSDLDRVRPAIRRSAQAMAMLAAELSAPAVGFRRVPIVDIRDDVLEVEGGVRFHCDAFASVLAGCVEIAAFALTVGPRLDDQVVKLTDAGELLDALLLETAGWLCIEDATRQFKVSLRELANAGNRRITSRMGPGYTYKVGARACIWALEEQGRLFSLFDGAILPVSLMASCAMQPKMSRSGLFGIAPIDELRQSDRANLYAMPDT